MGRLGAGRGRGPILLAHHRIVRAHLGEAVSQRPLDRGVGLADGRQIGLGLDDQVIGPEAGERDPIRDVGEFERDVQVLGGGGHGADRTRPGR